MSNCPLAVFILSCVFTACLTTGSIAVDDLYTPSNLRIEEYGSEGALLRWDYPSVQTVENTSPEELQFVVKYRTLTRGREPWKLLKTISRETRLPLAANSLYELQVSAMPTAMVSAGTSENQFLRQAPVSDRLSVETPETVPYAVPEHMRINLRPPTHLRLRILSTTEVQLDWSPPQMEIQPAELYYEVLVQKYERTRDQFGTPRIVRVTGTSVRLDGLKPGVSHKFLVIARTADYESEPSAFTIIQLPTDTEGITIGRLSVSADPVNDDLLLNWEATPPEVLARARNFVIHYSEDMNTPDSDWNVVELQSNVPSARVPGLKPDTLYYVKIETNFQNGAKSESSAFRLRSPKIHSVQDIKVGYEADGRVKLQWVLHRSIDKMDIVGYRLIYTDNNELPETEWTFISVPGREAEAYLPGLKVNERYYLKIYPETTAGNELSSPSTFMIRTYETQRHTFDSTVTLTYIKRSPTSVRIRWTTTTTNADKITGYTVLYSPLVDAPEEQWKKIMVTDPDKRELDLAVEPDRPYFIKIVPKIHDGYAHAVGIHKILEDTETPRESAVVNTRVVNARHRRSGQRVTLKLCRTTEHTAVGCESGELCLADPSCFGSSINVCAPNGLCIPTGLENGLRNHFSTTPPRN